MVADNVTSKDLLVRMMKDWLCEKSLLPLSEKLFHVQCTSYISNLIVQDGLKVIDGLVWRTKKVVST